MFKAVEAAAPIKHLAESAQADLAMDYAWLDDVTYRDWQNYHDLVRSEYSLAYHPFVEHSFN